MFKIPSVLHFEQVFRSTIGGVRFFSGYSGFPLSSKTNICQALYHTPLTRVIVQALPVFDIKFTFTFFYIFLPDLFRFLS